MLNHIKSYKRIFYIAGLVLCAALFAVLGKKSIKKDRIGDIVYSIHAHNDKETDDIFYQRLVKGDVIKQTFTPDTRIDGLSFCFHKEPDQKLAGHTFLTVTQKDNGVVVYEDEFDNTALPLDTLVDFKLYDTELAAGTQYEIIFTSDVEDETGALQLYMQGPGRYEGTLVVNGSENESMQLCLGAFRHSNVPDKLFNDIMSLAVVVLAIVLILAFAVKLPLHWVFVAACIGFGSIYMLMVAPGKGCDSSYHYNMVYEYSNKLMFKGSSDGRLYMRADDYEFYKRNFECQDGYYALMSADAYMDLRDTMSLQAKDTSMTDTGMYIDKGNFIPYIPYVLGLTAGRLLRLGALPCVYLARLFGIITFALIIGAAVKIIPVGREMLALVALMPMTLQEYSAFSYDGMCIAAAFLFTACWLYCMHSDEAAGCMEGKIPGDRTVLVLWIISAVLLGACKTGTYIFFILLLVATGGGLLSKKRKAAVGGSMAASAVLFNIARYALVAAEAMGLVIMASDGKYVPGSSYTLSYAIEHPWRFFLMCTGSLIEKADYYFGSIIGTHLSANIGTVPIAVVIPFFVIILMAGIRTRDGTGMKEAALSGSEKAAMCVSCLMSCLVIFFMMQVATPVGWNIDGVTGRYFIPILPLIFLCINGSGITISGGTKRRAVAVFMCWQVVEIFYAQWSFVIR